MFRMRIVSAGVFVLLLMATSVDAALLYELADSSGVAHSTFTIPNVGDTLPVQLYLTQTSPTTVLSADGLVSAGARLSYNGGIAHVAALGDVTPNSAFDVLSDVTFPDGNSVGIDLLASSAVTTPGNRILLGTFTLTGVADGSTALSAADLDPGFGVDNTLGWSGLSLDSSIANGFATVNVGNAAAVPEPSSCLMLGAGLAAWRVVRWRRRSRSAE